MLKLFTLRNQIPIGGPANREHCTGDEAFIRPVLGFTPAWYRDRLGIDFSENWHTDPRYRYEALVKMKACLHDFFPGIEHFTPQSNENGVDPTCATISGVYGIMLIPGIYGISLGYRENGWPDAACSKHITKEELEALPPFTEDYLMQVPVLKDLLRQMDIIENTWGMIHGYLNYQGVLNVAVKIMGSDFFVTMVEDPDFAKWLLNHIAQTIVTVSKMVQNRQIISGFNVDFLVSSNCTISMISPKQYEEFVLTLDQGFSLEYECFGVHTCNWVINPYLDGLRKIEKMGYIDTGMDSDLARVRELFPHARRAVIFTPGEVEAKSSEELYRDVDRLRKEYAPCDLVLADMETTVSEKKIMSVIEMAREFSREGEIV